MFVLFCNMFGMIPYAFTVTSHIAVTFALSMSIFIGVTTIGLLKHGLHFFSFFWPSGAPLALAPLLVPLEIVSYSFRSISLGVRLFANMMAGHTLVHILAGFSWRTKKNTNPARLQLNHVDPRSWRTQKIVNDKSVDIPTIMTCDEKCMTTIN